MKKLIFSVACLVSCASLDRDPTGGTPPDITGDPPTETWHPDAGNGNGHCPVCPLTCPAPEPECKCNQDCRNDESCHEGKCYQECGCDDDCSGPGNASCDRGLCKGH